MSDESAQLLQQVQQAISDGRSLCIQGGGSKHFMGRDVDKRLGRDDVLNTDKHSGIVNYQPVELVLTVRAGTSLLEIQQVLEANGQMLAFEPPAFAQSNHGASNHGASNHGASSRGATIAGTLACDQSGPARPWAGSIRDAVLGIRLINGLGEHLRFGGQVMKNVAGYDVSRAQAGALGTLGVITELSLKVMPKPAAQTTVAIAMGASDAIKSMNTLASVAQPLNGACWLNGELYLRWSGVEAATERAAEAAINTMGGRVIDEAATFWDELNNQRHDFFSGDESLWRFSLRSSAQHWRESEDWLIDWGGSQRWLRGDHNFSELEQEAGEAAGQVSLYRGGDRSGEVFATQPAVIQQLHQRLKAAFDPKGIFNPGRLYSWM